MNNFVEKILDQQNIVIQLIYAVNTDNQPFYAYVLMKADKWKDIERRMHRDNIDFSKEGKILASGMGHEPDAATRAAIEQMKQKLQSSEGK
jgi:hypothetical protein